MPKTKTYKVGEEIFDVPEMESELFIKDNPKAIEMKSFLSGKDTFDIPLNEVDLFVKDNPTAKPLYEDEVEKKKESLPSEFLAGQLPASDDETISEKSELNPPEKIDIDRLNFISPDLASKYKEALSIYDAQTNKGLKESIGESINEFADFTKKIKGTLVGDNTFIDINGNKIPKFENGDIVAVPKDKKLDNGVIYPSGLVQYKDGEWHGIQSINPSFSVTGENPTDNVTIIGFKQNKKPDYVKKLEEVWSALSGENFKAPAGSWITQEQWQKEKDQLGEYSKRLALYNRDNDKGATLPAFLNANPDLKENVEKFFAENPTKLASQEGRFSGVEQAVRNTYEIDKIPQNPFEANDVSEMVDAPLFYKNMQSLVDANKKISELKNKIDILKDNPKYGEKISSLNEQIKKIQDNVNPVVSFFQQPNNKRVLDTMESNDALFNKQKKGEELLNNMSQFFPQMRADDRKKIEMDAKALDNVWKDYGSGFPTAPLKSFYREAKNALIDFGALAANVGSDIVGLSNIPNFKEEFKSSIDELKNRNNVENYTAKLPEEGPNGETLIGSKLLNIVNDAAGMAGQLTPAIIGGSTAKMNQIIFGLQGYMSAKDQANKIGMGSDMESSAYALFNGALMTLLGSGIGSRVAQSAEKAAISPNVFKNLLNPSTRSQGAKELMKELSEGKLGDIVKGAARGTLEMKAIGIANALYNEMINKGREGKEKFSTEIGGIAEDMSNLIAFGLQHAAMAGMANKKSTAKEKTQVEDYLVLKSMQESPKKVLDEIDQLRDMPNIDQKVLDNAKSKIEDAVSKNFPEGTTAEQKVELAQQAKIIDENTKLKENTDKEYQAPYNEKIKEAQENINNILSNKKAAEEKVRANIKPVVEEINKMVEPEVVGEFGRNDYDNKTNNNQIKTEKNAIQEQSTGSILQQPQEGTGKEGSERTGMESGIKREESSSKEQPTIKEQKIETDENINEQANTENKQTNQSTEETGSTNEESNKYQQEAESKSSEGIKGSPEMIGITHEQMDDAARKLGLETYEKNPETVEQWDNQAKERLKNDPDSMNKVIQKLKNGEGVDKVETRMMIMHFADLMAKYEKNPTPVFLDKIKRTMDLYNISGTEKGQELLARKGMVPKEESLAQFHLRDIEYNKNAPLTEKQLEQSTKEYEEITSAKKVLDEKVAQLEIENAKLKAEKEIKKQSTTTQKAKKVHGDFVNERKKISESISEKLKKARGETSAIIVPYAKELIAITPDVLKLVKSYVEEGVINLGEIVKKVHSELKGHIPDIKEKDVVDIIAGEYSEKKKPRKKIAEQIFDLKRQAQLTNKLEKLLLGEEPKSEEKKVRRNQEIEELKSQIKDFEKSKNEVENKKKEARKEEERLIKEFEKEVDQKKKAKLAEDVKRQKAISKELDKKTPEESALQSLKTRMTNDIAKLENDLKTGNFEKEEKEPLKLDKEATDLRDEYLRLKEEREIRLMKQEYENRTANDKFIRGVEEVANVGRVSKSSFDVSMPGRQGLWASTSKLLELPIGDNKGFKQQKMLKDEFKNMYKSFGSENIRRRVMNEIYESPRFEMAQEAGLDIVNPLSKLAEKREEVYGPSLLEKIPLIKEGVKSSERAATTFINLSKWNRFNSMVDSFEKSGKTFKNSKDLYEAAATYANQSVGRGKLPKWAENANRITSKIFFSLRLQASRLQLMTYLINPKFYTKIPKEIRIEYLKDMAKFVATGTMALGVARALGFQVGVNPFSSDFGKIKIGNTEIDVWGGFGQWATFLIRMAAAKTSDRSDIMKETKRGDILSRFARSKLSPEAGAIVNLLYGKNYLGEETSLGREAVNFITPLMASDIYESYQDGGVQNAFITALLASHGVGVQTILPKENELSELNIDNPIVKQFEEKNIDIPKLSKNIEIEDNIDGKPVLKKLSDYDEEKVSEFEQLRKEYIVNALEREKGYIFIDKYGRYSTNGEDGKKRVRIEDLPDDKEKEKALKVLIQSIGSNATKKAKQKLFPGR